MEFVAARVLYDFLDGMAAAIYRSIVSFMTIGPVRAVLYAGA
jgi:hypothetical protein